MVSIPYSTADSLWDDSLAITSSAKSLVAQAGKPGKKNRAHTGALH